MLMKQAQEIVLHAHEIMKRELTSWTKEVEIFRKALSSSKQMQASLEDELRTTKANILLLQRQSMREKELERQEARKSPREY
jgi:hypothetical protein